MDKTSGSNKNRGSKLPQAPPLHEEPLRGIEAGKLSCRICGKTFTNKTRLTRHMEHMHGTPEKTHTKDHSEL